jgi:hypothetical protein
MVSVRFQEILFTLKNVATFEVLLFHVIDGVEFLLSETEGLRHHTAADIGHGVKVDIDAE